MIIYPDISIFTKLSSRKCGFSSTCNIQNWGLIGYSKVVARIKCRVA
jgi:hypothetical protein